MKRKRKTPILGVDLGGVVIDNDAIDQRTGIRYPKHNPDIPEVEGAGETLRHICFHAVPVFIITSGRPDVDEKRRKWLNQPRYWGDSFYEHTGIPYWNVRFCEERKKKLAWCAHEQVTHFIDNRADVLASLIGTVPYLYLFGPKPLLTGATEEQLAEFQRAESWRQLLPLLLDDIGAYRERLRNEKRRVYGLSDAE